MQKCALVTMQHVVKALAGRRLVNFRKMFYEITTNLFVYIVGLWTRHLQDSISRIPSGSAESAMASLEMTHICLKSRWSSVCVCGEGGVERGKEEGMKCVLVSGLLQFCVRWWSMALQDFTPSWRHW